jgi:hypothetical protein
VRVNVSRASNGMQVPWEASSLTGDFYFTGGAPAATAAAAPSQQTLDLAFWEAVKGSSNPVELQAYLETFPSGTFAPLARARMASLSRAAPATAAAPAPPASAPVSAPVAPAPPARIEPAKPTQEAALTPAGAALPAGAFNGRYLGLISAPRGALNLQIEVDGNKVIGFGAGVAICRVNGSIDAAGTIQQMSMECPNSSWAFSGSIAATGDSTLAIRSTNSSQTSLVLKKAGSS